MIEKGAPEKVLATINFGWESEKFYSDGMQGDKEAGREIKAAMLDFLNAQCEQADALLDLFREILASNPSYVARLQRHYRLSKRTLKLEASARRPA